MRRDAEVAPNCLLRSLVMRKKRDSLDKGRLRPKREEEEEEEEEKGELGRVIMVSCITT